MQFQRADFGQGRGQLHGDVLAHRLAAGCSWIGWITRISCQHHDDGRQPHQRVFVKRDQLAGLWRCLAGAFGQVLAEVERSIAEFDGAAVLSR